MVPLINKDGSINRWGSFSGNSSTCFTKLDSKEKIKDVECKRIQAEIESGLAMFTCRVIDMRYQKELSIQS